MGQWLDLFIQWLDTHPQWLGVVIALTSFSECLAIVGLLIPGTLVLFTLGALAGNGVLGSLETLLLAFAGGLLGDIASYAIGRRYHQGIRQLPILRDHPKWLALAEQYFQRYGIASLLVGRFIGAVRPFLPLTAGMLDMPFSRFVLVSIPASFGWAAVYILPGWAAGAAFQLPLPEGFWSEAGIVTLVVLLALALIFHSALRQRAHTHLLAFGAFLGGFMALSLMWRQLQALDQGSMDLIQQARQPALDHIMIFITQLGDLSVQTVVGVLLVAMLAAFRHWPQALLAALALSSTALLNTALKAGFSRLRPDLLVEPLSSHSYPSAHSSAAFAFALTLAFLAGRQQVLRMQLAWVFLACIPAAAIAGSRMYLGVHWSTDILAGALLAALCCSGALALVQRLYPGQLIALPANRWWLILSLCLGTVLIYGVWNFPDALLSYQAK